ncbi:MAG: hypothetical protein ACJAXJ_003807 [Colwellia sp.]
MLLTKPLPVVQRAIALNNLATIHIIKKDYKLAVTQAKQAIEITNTIPAFFDTTDWALTLLGDVKEGFQSLRRYRYRSNQTKILIGQIHDFLH